MMKLLRIPLLRALVPRGRAPLLPLTRISPSSPLSSSSTSALTSSSRSRLFSHLSSNKDSSSSSSSSLPPDISLSQRLKHLIKSYGWYALGVYIVLSSLDFCVAFAAINLLGAQQVSQVANAVKQTVRDMIPSKPPEPGRDEVDSITDPAAAGGSEGLYAMLVLAYTVHKTLFLPVRVGLTAWLTPRLVGWLRVRGWAGGEGTRRAATEMREKIRNSRRSRSRD